MAYYHRNSTSFLVEVAKCGFLWAGKILSYALLYIPFTFWTSSMGNTFIKVDFILEDLIYIGRYARNIFYSIWRWSGFCCVPPFEPNNKFLISRENLQTAPVLSPRSTIHNYNKSYIYDKHS